MHTSKHHSSLRAARSPKSRTPRFEALEDRCFLNATDALVGDSTFVLYNDAVYGTAAASFDRDVATVDSSGIYVDVDQRRYGDSVSYSPVLEWQATGVSLNPISNVSIIASGWDHDGTTPLILVEVSGSNQLHFYRGNNLEHTGNISWADGLQIGQAENIRYQPRGAIIHHGLVVIALERREVSEAGSETPIGTSFVTTQDYGQTLDRVAYVDGELDVPVIAGGVSKGIFRGREWSFANPFPVNGLDDQLAAWFPWADYLHRSGNPKGGQVGLFQATRSDTSSAWLVQPNRVIHEQWEASDSGGLHSHAAAITSAGVISHWGDVGYRNQTLLHSFDLNNYLTAPITTTIVSGGFDATATLYQIAAQPVATAPAPIEGEHFASADLTQEIVLKYSDLDSASDYLDIDGVVTQPLRSSSGGFYEGSDVLHLQWLQGVGYISGAAGKQIHHFSPDGTQWTALTSEGASGRWWLFGDQFIRVGDGNQLFVADLPSVETVSPLLLSPGGTNLQSTKLTVMDSGDAGVTQREVQYTNGVWSYIDSGQALSVQAPAPPFDAEVTVYEISTTAPAKEYGTLWLTPEGQLLNTNDQLQLDTWIANLGTNTVAITQQLIATDLNNSVNKVNLTGYNVSETVDWVSLGSQGNFGVASKSRLALQLRSSQLSTEERFLIGIRSLTQQSSPTYPLAPQQSGSDEQEVLTGFETDSKWTIGAVLQWPENAPQQLQSDFQIATFRGSLAGNFVTVSLRHFGATNGRLRIDFYLSGEQVASHDYVENFLRGDLIEFVISNDGKKLVSSARIGRNFPDTRTTIQTFTSPLNEFAWHSAEGQVTMAVNPLFVFVDDNHGATSSEHDLWMKSSLAEKAVMFAEPIDGDLNGDGVVNAMDFAYWRETLQPLFEFNFKGNYNGDQVIDHQDLAVWKSEYGTTSLSPADGNGDGVVNAQDYAIWREAFEHYNTLLTLSDISVVKNHYGSSDRTIGEVLSIPLDNKGQPTVPEITNTTTARLNKDSHLQEQVTVNRFESRDSSLKPQYFATKSTASDSLTAEELLLLHGQTVTTDPSKKLIGNLEFLEISGDNPIESNLLLWPTALSTAKTGENSHFPQIIPVILFD